MPSIRSLSLVVVLIAQPLTAQNSGGDERGFPFITNYSPRDYDGPTQVWCALEDSRGIMLFCGSDGIMEFDGTSWRKIQTPERSTIRSMAIREDGTVFAGAVGDLGYLESDSRGNLRFVSLIERLPEDVRDFTDVWETHVGPDGIYFVTVKHVYRWDGTEFSVITADRQFHLSEWVNGRFFVRQWDVGLMWMEDGQLSLVPGGERFAQERIYVMLPWDDGRILLGTRTQGLLLFDGEQYERFPTEADAFLARNLIYLPGLELADGSIVFGTVYGGAIRIGRDGHVIQTYTQETGIINDAVYYVAGDSNGDIWLTTDSGISRVEVGSPFTVFDERAGLTTRPYNAHRLDSRLFVGHQGGVYEMRGGRLSDVSGISEQIFHLTYAGGSVLAAGTQSGIFEIQDGQANLVAGSPTNRLSTWHLLPASWDDSILFAGLSDGMAVIKREPSGSWVETSRVEFVANATTLVEEEPGTIWIGSLTDGAIRVTFPIEDGLPNLTHATIEEFGVEDGLGETSALAYKIADRVYFSTRQGVYTFDPVSRQFKKDARFHVGDEAGPGEQAGLLVELESGVVWLVFDKQIAYGVPQENGAYDWVGHPFTRLEDAQVSDVLPEEDGTTWFVTLDGLVRYDPKMTSVEAKPVDALIRRVTITGDSVLYGGGQIGIAHHELESSQNEIHFEYATPSYTETSKNTYQTKLAGFDDGWSEWTTDSRRTYTNLPAGDYRFLVRARNVQGTESSEASFGFAILPPWYQTWWAYLIYIVGAVGAVLGFVRLRTSQLQSRQRELEKTVEERTAEIRQRVEELAVINSVQQGLVAEMDMQGIYDLVGDRIRDLFDAQVVVIRSYKPEEGLMTLHYAIEKGERVYMPPVKMDGFHQRVSQLRDALVVNEGFAEYAAEHGSTQATAGEMPKCAVLAPLIVGDAVRGNISIQNVDHENAFSESDVRLLTTLANSMSVALENARLFHETNRLLDESDQRAGELATVNEISKALVSQLEFDALVKLVGDQIQQTFKADVVYVAFLDRKTNVINFPYGYGEEFPPLEFGEGLTSQIIKTGEPLLINEDVKGSYEKLGLEEVGQQVASYLGVPISERGEVVGVVSVQSMQEEGRFDENDMRLLWTIAANVGIALQNAESYRELQKTLQDLKSTQEQLVTQEKMASLGQLTAGIAHEIKNPLNFVNNFSELNQELAADGMAQLQSGRGKGVDDIYDELFEIMMSLKTNAAQISKHGRRADSIVKNMMQHASGGQTERFRVEVNAFVDEYVGLAYHGMRAQTPDLNVNIVKNFDERAGNAEMSPQELGRVLLNLVNNALYAVHEKATSTNGEYTPTVTVSTKRQGGLLEIEVADNGPGIPDHVKDRIFEPLFTTKPTGSGTGLGLSLAFDIVTQVHKGEIRVDTRDGEGTTFVVRIPA